MTRMWVMFLMLFGWAMTPATAQVTNDTATETVAEADAPGLELRIGVRGAARPFSYETFKVPRNVSTGSGPIRAAGYDGYMVYICDVVLKQMLIRQDDTPDIKASQITVHDIDELSKTRRDELKKLAEAANEEPVPFDRFDLLGDKIDIMCDPATINTARVKRFAVSPPLFITGVGYLTRKGSVAPASACRKDKALIGFVGTTNAASHSIQIILQSGEWRTYRDYIIAALRSPKDSKNHCNNTNGLEEQGGVFWAGDTHDDVAKKFCDGSITYYVGDLEIIAEHASRHAGCAWLRGPRSFTTDRYAIFANVDYNEIHKSLLIGRFFEVLNREIATSASLLDRAYIATFGETTRSKKLEAFFWSLRGSPGGALP
ncbi:hypothetical protein [uncultured Roseobacter sp.]|uniref:hypothetical protein n=1 Tax=uncultured Roseobacter sp. TaxID=114847 RepID=UPI002627486B|nr:hypothetical protein [uncultured Roseobacter sp.]